MFMIMLSQEGLIGIAAGSAALVIVAFILIYFFAIRPIRIKGQVKELAKRFSYLDAKLIGQDSQYFHRLEIISRTNLLYLDKYEVFSRRFKAIFENEDKYCDSMLKRLNSLIAAKQFKHIGDVILEAKKSIDVFEESVTAFDADLYEIIKLEEECRKSIDGSKETYRHIKQTYYSESTEIQMVAGTFAKAFEKIDNTFANFDELIERAEYDEINDQIPVLNNVLTALGKVLIELPDLCSLSKTIIIEKITDIQNKYNETEKDGIPLYHLGFKKLVEDWKKRLNEINKKIINLQIYGVHSECELILAEIEDVSRQLDEEVNCRNQFNEKYKSTYENVNAIEKVFVKLCASLPQVKEIFKIDEQERQIEELSVLVGNLSNAKRFLEGFVYSGIKQPYSLLKKQLDELSDNYDLVETNVQNFKNYIDSLKSTSEEAYKMVFVYYKRVKEIEQILSEINIPEFKDLYTDKIEAIYDVLNDIYNELNTQPINVIEVSNKIEQLKNIANAMFDEIDENATEAKVSENLLAKLGTFRNQEDINQSFKTLEGSFYKGQFKNVHNQAEVLLQNLVEE